jgi:hypothetical protein
MAGDGGSHVQCSPLGRTDPGPGPLESGSHLPELWPERAALRIFGRALAAPIMPQLLIRLAALFLITGCNPERTTFAACFDDQGFAMRLSTGSNPVNGDLPCELDRNFTGVQR